MARYLCARSGKPMIRYLSDLLRPSVERDFNKAGREILKGKEGTKGE
jgi:hypothetical protein